MSFKHLQSLSVRPERTAEFVLGRDNLGVDVRGVDGKVPVLICVAGTHHNPGLLNAVQRRGKGAREEEADSPEARAAGRLRDARLLAEHVIRDWRNVADDQGDAGPYTAEKGREFLEALARDADWIFDAFRVWSRNPANFVEGYTADVEQTAKNS